VSLGIGIVGLHHFAGLACFISAPPWDYSLGIALPMTMGFVAAGGVALGLVRLALFSWTIARRSFQAAPELQALADGLAEQLSAPQARVLLRPYNRPLALTYGLLRPRILLSTWMVDHLSQRELEAVLAHELAHVVRHDYFVVWVATVLRDAFFYLPTSWAAHRQLVREKELACDDLAVAFTRRRLDLASALARVWEHAAGAPNPETAQALLGVTESIEGRIGRLLRPQGAPTKNPGPRLLGLGLGASGLTAIIALEAVTTMTFLTPMGCSPLKTFLNIV
jgi:beta-lactamase regulating signal transducer with metallopeptidase domain